MTRRLLLTFILAMFFLPTAVFAQQEISISENSLPGVVSEFSVEELLPTEKLSLFKRGKKKKKKGPVADAGGLYYGNMILKSIKSRNASCTAPTGYYAEFFGWMQGRKVFLTDASGNLLKGPGKKSGFSVKMKDGPWSHSIKASKLKDLSANFKLISSYKVGGAVRCKFTYTASMNRIR